MYRINLYNWSEGGSMGSLFVVSGPSAVGKTTVVSYLVKSNPQVQRVITCTTRPKRQGEVNGQDYIFMTEKEFAQHKKDNDFAECSEVYGNHYGVLLESVRESIKKYPASILVINWEGFSKIKKFIKEDIIGIFITPPSMEELRKRMDIRGLNQGQDLEKRMQEAEHDISFAKEYDIVIKNHDVEKTAASIMGIIMQNISDENN